MSDHSSLPAEVWWREHSQWLHERGYLLRPRFRAGWKTPSNREESLWLWGKGDVIDAVRTSDGTAVALKRTVTVRETEVMQLLNTEPLASSPDNPCVPLYEVLNPPDAPDRSILVMPFLRQFDSPPFRTIGEVMEFCRQALYGLRFLHTHNIAHRQVISLRGNFCLDPHASNIMLDPRQMYPHGFYTGYPGHDYRRPSFKGHAEVYTRTQRPSKYFWIDYGLADTFEFPSLPGTLLVPYVRGGDRDIPETLQGVTHADPFASDVWWMGSIIKELIEVSVQKYHGLDMLSELVDAMCREKPEDRPTIATVVGQFDVIGCSSWRLRQMTARKKDVLGRTRAFPAFIFHTLGYLITGKSAMPRPQ
ncbi:hypothetical protein R3P38DRAFT_2630078, partial [Favolaschia claudopus]